MVTLKFESRLVTDALVSNAPNSKTSKHDLLIINLYCHALAARHALVLQSNLS